MQRLTALIFDDHKLFVTSFALLLKSTKKFHSIAGYDKIEDLKKALASDEINYLFIDYLVPGIDILSEIRNITEAYPALKIIVISSITNAHLVYQLQKVGAQGFVSKTSDLSEIIECIDVLNNKKYFVCKYLRNALLDLYLNGKEVFFTEAELKIMQHIGKGYTIEEIAEQLNLSRHTIVAHRRNMMEKFKVNSIAALLKIAMEMQVVV